MRRFDTYGKMKKRMLSPSNTAMSIIEHAGTPRFFTSEKIPQRAELTLREAADILLVSESFLAALLDSGEIPSQKIGNRVRINPDDLLAFQAEQKRFHLETVDELVEEGQLLNPNY